MTAALDRISAALKVDLDADPLTNFGYTFTTEESGGDFDLELEDTGPPSNPQVLTVDLVNAGDEMELASTVAADGTKDVKHTCAFQVIIRKRLTERVESTGKLKFSVIQGLTECTEKIAMYFMGRELSTLAEASWKESKVEMARYPRDLRENGQFTGIARITYELTERD